MNTSTSKTVVVITIVAVIGVFVYMGFSKKETDTLTSTDALGTTEGSLEFGGGDVGGDIRALLEQLNSLKIDSEIFTSPAYKSLNDYSNPIPPLAQGKKNPFAPLFQTVKATKPR